MRIRDKEVPTLFERRIQLIQAESFFLIAALLSQLAFMLWLGFGTRSLDSVIQECLKEPLLMGLQAVNLIFWVMIFSARFFWMGFDRAVNHDLQTGLFNRLHFEKLLETEMRRAGRYHYPATLCLLDLKNRGPETLQRFAGFLRASVRITDLLARREGDEFYILLPHTDLVRSEKFIQRLLAQAQERLDCSFSAGLTAYHAGESREQLIERALAGLAEARRDGRGKIRCVISGQDSHAVLSF